MAATASSDLCAASHERSRTAFLKERVLSRRCRPLGRVHPGLWSACSRREPVAGRVEVDPLELSASGEGGQGRAEPARRGSLDGPVSVINRLDEEGRQALLFAGLSSGVLAAGSVFSGGLAELGGRSFLRRAGWGRHAAIRPQPVGLKHKLGPLWGHAVRRARNRLRRAAQPASARQRISPSRRP